MMQQQLRLEKNAGWKQGKYFWSNASGRGMVSGPAGNGNSDFLFRTCIEFCGNCMQNLVVWYHVGLV